MRFPSQKSISPWPRTRLRYCRLCIGRPIVSPCSPARGPEPSVACLAASHRPLRCRDPALPCRRAVVVLSPPRLGTRKGCQLRRCSTRRASRGSRLSPTLAHDATNLRWGSLAPRRCDATCQIPIPPSDPGNAGDAADAGDASPALASLILCRDSNLAGLDKEAPACACACAVPARGIGTRMASIGITRRRPGPATPDGSHGGGLRALLC